MQESEVLITLIIVALFIVIYCILLVVSAWARMRQPPAHLAVQQVSEPQTRMTICNGCQKRKLCTWTRVGIGNVWLCAWCARGR